MTIEEFNSDKLTEEQRKSMRDLHERSGIKWRVFLANSHTPGLGGYVGVLDFHGMYVKIERDGYTHT